MNGKDYYINQLLIRIDNVLQDNKIDKPYLYGFYYYIKDILTPSSAYKYIGHVINFMDEVDKTIEELTVDDYLYFLGNKNNGNTASYQICVYSALKRFSEYLYISGKNKTDSMKYIKRPKFSEKEETIQKREVGFLSQEEIKQYIDNVMKGVGNHNARVKQEKWRERDLSILLIFLSTGIRCSALFKLDVDSVDFENHILIVTDKGNKVSQYLLNKEVEKILKKWIEKRKKLGIDNSEHALFVSNKRTRFSVEGISLVVRKYSAGIEGKHITPHKLRATYGTQLYNETHDIRFVQSCMNHGNPKTTELYIRGNKNIDKQRAAEIASKFLQF